MSVPLLGIVTGLKSEARILRGLGFACISVGGKAQSAPDKIARLIEGGATGLVSFGIAGALHPELRTGDVVVADVVRGGAGEVLRAHDDWARTFSPQTPLVTPALSRGPSEGQTRADEWVPAQGRDDGRVGARVGALHPDLRAGDVVVAEAVVGSNAERWQCHAAWVAALSPHTPPVTPPTDVGLRRRPLSRGPSEGQARADEWVPAQGRDDGRGDGELGAILGLDRLLSSPQEKAAAFARTGALAIDMESHHVARAAAERGLPFIAVRAISDRADETLPACLADFVDADGGTKLSAVLAALIFRRVKLRDLVATGRASRRAHQALFGCRGALAGLR